MSDQQTITPPPGQGDSAPAFADKAAAAPFYEYMGPDGKKESFGNADELTKKLRESYLRQSDYTRKTQELSTARKQHDEQIKKFQEDQKAFLESKKRYDEWDRALKNRPDIYEALQKMAGAPNDPSAFLQSARGYTDETSSELKQRLEAIEKAMEEDKTKREIESEMSALKEKYPDVDEGEIMARLEYLSDGKTGPLLDLLYWAHKGQMNPAQMEQKITEGLQKKAKAKLTPAKGSGGPASPVKYANTDEARQAAMEAEGIVPG